MIQYLAGELVAEDRIADARDGGLVEWQTDDSVRRNGARVFYDSIDNTANGVLGDQTDASAAKGERMFEAATDQLVALCEWLDAQPFESLLPDPRV